MQGHGFLRCLHTMRIIPALSLCVLATWGLGVGPALAEAEGAPARVGVVTTVDGPATVGRSSLAQPVALGFRDDVFVNDRIVTGEGSIVRVLLGGRAVVTVRERSVLTIEESEGLAVVHLEAGKVAVAVARERLRP